MKSELISDIPASSEGAVGAAAPQAPPASGEVVPAYTVAIPGAPLRPSLRLPPATLDFALMRGALEEMPFGVATMRGDVVVYANETLTRLFGAQPGGLARRLR